MDIGLLIMDIATSTSTNKGLPSGKHTKKLEKHHFEWVNQRTK